MQWGFSKDPIGQHMIAAVSAANKLRTKYAALRKGWANILHEDRPNGVSGMQCMHGDCFDLRLYCIHAFARLCSHGTAGENRAYRSL